MSKTVTNAVLKYSVPSLILLLFWLLLWSTIGPEADPPNGSLFNVLLILFVSYIFGQLVSVLRLPPLIGMLFSGFAFGNIFDPNLNQKLSSIIRSVALTIILLRAGLGLDPKVIRKLSYVCLRLSLIPCTVEAIVLSVCTYLLVDFPLKWGFLMGFVLSAVSSAVVIPEMIALQETRLGTDKGIPTLLMASASVDNVMAITGFGVCLGLVFDSSSSIVWNVFKGPVEAVTGVVVGLLFGITLWVIPDHEVKSEEKSSFLRVTLLTLFGLNCVLVSSALNFGGAGPLGCLVVAFVASIKWRAKGLDQSVRESLKYLWIVFEPLLFALIGTEVKTSDLSGDTIGFAILSLFIGLIGRSIATALVVYGNNFTIKEKLFISLAWISKATVQAAVGPIALDSARAINDPELEELAKFVLTIAVLSIMITAPLGAIAISVTKNHFLVKDNEVKCSCGENRGSDEALERKGLLCEC